MNSSILKGYNALHRAAAVLASPAMMRRLAKAAANGHDSGLAHISLLNMSARAVSQVMERHTTDRIVLIADIGSDGEIYKRAFTGPTAFLPDPALPQRRKRPVSIASVNGVLGRMKSFKGKRSRFLNELGALNVLSGAGCNVPSILHVDTRDLTLITSYIPGADLRTLARRMGARVSDRDFHGEQLKFARRMSRTPQKREWIVTGARDYLDQIFNDGLEQSIRQQFEKIHHCGFLLNDVHWGNVLVSHLSGEPFLIEVALDYRWLPRSIFQVALDNELDKIDRFIFGRGNFDAAQRSRL